MTGEPGRAPAPEPESMRERFVRGFESTAPAGAEPPGLYLDEPIPLSRDERIALATLRRLVDRGVIGPPG